MKNRNFWIIAIILAVSLSSIGIIYAEGERDVQFENQQQTSKASASNIERAIASIPVPTLSYFQERRTIEKWAKRWDKPSVPCYVYLFNYGVCIGYFVSDGKPASTRSYLTPESYSQHHENCVYTTEQNPDLDGTYGDNNFGIRFFTASGSAVEAGAGISYVYSDTPLKLSVPKLN